DTIFVDDVGHFITPGLVPYSMGGAFASQCAPLSGRRQPASSLVEIAPAAHPIGVAALALGRTAGALVAHGSHGLLRRLRRRSHIFEQSLRHRGGASTLRITLYLQQSDV